jgi:DNA-binding transcriptional LysR family regulator
MHPDYPLDLDLNLLRALDALLEAESVTGAARRLGLTQPALSRALARLRAHLHDPLLVRVGRRLTLTPRAREMARPLRQALQQLGATLAERPPFEPGRCRRTFRVATVDYGAAVLVPPLVNRLAVAAPGAGLVIVNQREDFSAALESGALDLVVVPRRDAWAGIVWRPLFEDRFVCLVRRGHPTLRKRKPLTLAAYCAFDHIVVAPQGGGGASPIDAALARLGRQRRIAVRVPSFLLAPRVIATSDLILTIFSRVISDPGGDSLRALRPPLPLPGVSVSLAWHENLASDAEHAWFRDIVSQTARELPAISTLTGS